VRLERRRPILEAPVEVDERSLRVGVDLGRGRLGRLWDADLIAQRVEVGVGVAQAVFRLISASRSSSIWASTSSRAAAIHCALTAVVRRSSVSSQ
jgi:hypothetical protein